MLPCSSRGGRHVLLDRSSASSNSRGTHSECGQKAPCILTIRFDDAGCGHPSVHVVPQLTAAPTPSAGSQCSIACSYHFHPSRKCAVPVLSVRCARAAGQGQLRGFRHLQNGTLRTRLVQLCIFQRKDVLKSDICTASIILTSTRRTRTLGWNCLRRLQNQRSVAWQ